MRVTLALAFVCFWTPSFAQNATVAPRAGASGADVYWSPRYRVTPEGRADLNPKQPAFGAISEAERRAELARQARLAGKTEPEGEWGDAPPPSESVLRRAPPVTTPVPVLDAERWCRRHAYGVDNGTLSRCIQNEQASYDYAQTMWPALSEAGRRYCALINGPKPVDGYYGLVASCVSGRLANERNERERNEPPPRFRY